MVGSKAANVYSILIISSCSTLFLTFVKL